MKNANKTLIVAAVAAIAGLAVYLYTSLTGYLASAALNTTPVLCTLAAVVLLAVVIAAGSRLAQLVNDVAIAASGALLLVSIYQFVLARVSLAADVYFIPVNYPAAEATALHISIVGAVLYLVAYIALIAAAFTSGKGSKA